MLLAVDGRGARGNALRLEGDLRQPEIKNLGVPVLGYKNVRRLDVAVNDALGVRRIQSVGDFDGERFPADAPRCGASALTRPETP
jgi:hypothetical protein